jgi:hypothetical protein
MTKLRVGFRNFANAPKNCKDIETESMEDGKKVKYRKMNERNGQKESNFPTKGGKTPISLCCSKMLDKLTVRTERRAFEVS